MLPTLTPVLTALRPIPASMADLVAQLLEAAAAPNEQALAQLEVLSRTQPGFLGVLLQISDSASASVPLRAQAAIYFKNTILVGPPVQRPRRAPCPACVWLRTPSFSPSMITSNSVRRPFSDIRFAAVSQQRHLPGAARRGGGCGEGRGSGAAVPNQTTPEIRGIGCKSEAATHSLVGALCACR